MRYLAVAEVTEKWNVSRHSVRNYCALGRVPGAFLTGKTWNKDRFAVGNYKKLLNEVGGMDIALPEEVADRMKECLKYNIVPFIVEHNMKMFYYRGLKEWDNESGYLIDVCLTVQDRYKAYLDYFRIAYYILREKMIRIM